jgi:hypothetical protein
MLHNHTLCSQPGNTTWHPAAYRRRTQRRPSAGRMVRVTHPALHCAWLTQTKAVTAISNTGAIHLSGGLTDTSTIQVLTVKYCAQKQLLP